MSQLRVGNYLLVGPFLEGDQLSSCIRGYASTNQIYEATVYCYDNATLARRFVDVADYIRKWELCSKPHCPDLDNKLRGHLDGELQMLEAWAVGRASYCLYRHNEVKFTLAWEAVDGSSLSPVKTGNTITVYTIPPPSAKQEVCVCGCVFRDASATLLSSPHAHGHTRTHLHLHAVL